MIRATLVGFASGARLGPDARSPDPPAARMVAKGSFTNGKSAQITGGSTSDAQRITCGSEPQRQ